MSRVLRSPAIRAASRIACLLAASKCKGTAIVQSDGTEPSSRAAVTHSWCKSIASSCVAEKCCTVPCEVTSRSSASALLNEASKRALSSAAHPAGLFTRNDTAPSPTKRRRSLKATTEGVCRREASFTSTSTPPRRGDAITEFTLPMSIPSKPEPLAPVGMVTSSRSHRAGIVADAWIKECESPATWCSASTGRIPTEPRGAVIIRTTFTFTFTTWSSIHKDHVHTLSVARPTLTVTNNKTPPFGAGVVLCGGGLVSFISAHRT